MSKPINLRAERKTRKRVQNRAQGDENAAKFGRSKAQKENETRAEDTARAAWQAHRRDPQ